MTVLTEMVFAAEKSDPSGLTHPQWQGRFPYNDIITLLDVNRPFNLAESTSQDLTVGDVLDMAGLETLRGLKLGYAGILLQADHARHGNCREDAENGDDHHQLDEGETATSTSLDHDILLT